MKIKFSIWLWLILGLVIRLYKINLIRCIAGDGVAYINVARDLIEGKGFNPTWPPLYPWFISLLIHLGINPELSGQFVSVVFGVLTIAMVYLVTKSIFSPTIAHISTVFSVFHPYLVRYSSEVLADSMFTFLITSTVFCGWLVMQKKHFFLVLLTGFLTGLAYLTKPEGIFLLVIISIWWMAGQGKWHKRLAQVFCAWVVFFIISFPYLYAIHRETGRWMLSQKETVVFSIALREEGLATEFLNISPLEYVRENPSEFFIKIGKGLLSLLGKFPDAYNPILFILLIVGLVSGIREKRFLFYIFTFLILFFIGYAIFHPGRRYLVGWVPLTIFLAAHGVQRVSRLTRNTWIPILTIILVMLPKTLESIRLEGIRWKEAGLWIKDIASGKISVMSEDSRVAFYAGGEYISWSESGFNKADYIVTSQDIPWPPMESEVPKGFRRILRDSFGNSCGVLRTFPLAERVRVGGLNIYYVAE